MGLIAHALRISIAFLFGLLGAAAVTIFLQVGNTAQNQTVVPNQFKILIANSIRFELLGARFEGKKLQREQLVHRLAQLAPLDTLPYEIALIDAIDKRSVDEATDFARRVLMRQPRNFTALLFLISQADQPEELIKLLEYYNRVMNIQVLDPDLLADAVVGVVKTNGSWEGLLEHLMNNPPHGHRLMSKLIAQPLPRIELEPVLLVYPELQETYLHRLVSVGDYQSAYAAWKYFAKLPNGDRIATPFNSRFYADRSEPPPFNWELTTDNVEMLDRGGLYVTYLGRKRELLATQLIHAPPGKYSLVTLAEGALSQRNGSLEWVITCDGINAPISRGAIQLTGQVKQQTSIARVTIGENDCKFQQLQLLGLPGVFPAISRVVILSVELVPLT